MGLGKLGRRQTQVGSMAHTFHPISNKNKIPPSGTSDSLMVWQVEGEIPSQNVARCQAARGGTRRRPCIALPPEHGDAG